MWQFIDPFLALEIPHLLLKISVCFTSLRSIPGSFSFHSVVISSGESVVFMDSFTLHGRDEVLKDTLIHLVSVVENCLVLVPGREGGRAGLGAGQTSRHPWSLGGFCLAVFAAVRSSSSFLFLW